MSDTGSHGTRIGRLRQHVDMLAEMIGQRNSAHDRGLALARDYMLRELRGMGYEPIEHRFAITGREAVNFEVVWPGTRAKRATLVIGAHYDSAMGTPGADDNASAVAILLEILREMVGCRSKRTVRAVFYDAEEAPHFSLGETGSLYHARQCRERGERLLGMLCLESLGYFQKPQPAAEAPRWLRVLVRLLGGRHVALVCQPRSAGFLWRVWWRMTLGSGIWVVPFVAPRRVRPIELSDHRPYWDAGYAALMLTDTAFLRNPHYHQPTDRLATLDVAAMDRLCGQLARVVPAVAGMSSLGISGASLRA